MRARVIDGRDFLVTALLIGLGLGLGIGLAPAQAQAQAQPEASAEDKMQAKVHFERAEALKQSGRARADTGDMDGARAAYSEAAGLYLRAYRLFPHAAFVYNAAQMHRLSNETGPAIAAYERYLEMDPKGPKAAEARTYLTQLRRNQAAQAAGAEADPDAAEEEDGEQDDGADEDGEDEDGEESADEDLADEDDLEQLTGAGDEAQAGDAQARDASAGIDGFDEGEPARTGKTLRIAGMATAAVGVIGFGIGIKYGLDARSIADDLSQPRSMWGFEERELFEDGERAERKAIILMGIGGAALVAGGVLYLVGHNKDADVDSKSLAVSASASPDGVSMLLWGRF